MPRQRSRPTAADAPPAPHRFGAHMSIAGGHDRAVHAATAVGFTALQVFTKSNNQWKAKPLTDEAIAAFRAALAEPGSPARWRMTRT